MILRQVTAFVMLKFLNFSQCWGGLRAARLLFRDAGCKYAKKKILKTVSVTPSDLITCTHQVPFFPLGKTASARMVALGHGMEHRWHRPCGLGSLCVTARPVVAGGCRLGVLWSLSGVTVSASLALHGSS